MSRHRILLVTEVFPPRHGGSGRWLWELYRRLPALDVRVLAGPAAGAPAFDRAAPLPIERFGSMFGSWGARGLPQYGAVVRRILRDLRGERRDVVHCGRCLPEGLAASIASRLTGVPFWCFAHGEELTLAAGSRELRWLASRVLGRAERIVANSEHTKRLLIEQWRLPDDRIAVLTPGVDIERFRPAAIDPVVRARLGWQGRRVILTVGALQRRKGQDMLVRALPAIRARCPDVRYAMAGEGWERAALESLAASLGVSDCVQFVGVADDAALVELYQQCDLFALPNRQVGWDFEGFGIVLLEAQACGRPVVTGTSGGTGETMRDGITGVRIACEEPEPLAAACIDLLEDPVRRARLGEQARAWAIEHFSWDVLVPRAMALFTGT
ncbi:MAG: glycosyltransferase family 4 protein [Acidobacteria bacterium]|nr:glycosyltransferase family 4 protein [Acidobacteriota bacterium]